MTTLLGPPRLIRTSLVASLLAYSAAPSNNLCGHLAPTWVEGPCCAITKAFAGPGGLSPFDGCYDASELHRTFHLVGNPFCLSFVACGPCVEIFSTTLLPYRHISMLDCMIYRRDQGKDPKRCRGSTGHRRMSDSPVKHERVHF